MKTSIRYLGSALIAGMLGFAGHALASTAANTTITNTVTVSFDDTSGNNQTPVQASVAFTVNLVPTAPLVTVPANFTGTETTTYNLDYVLTGTANGEDTYNIGNASVDTTMDGAPTFGGATTVSLGGTTVATAVTAGDTTITVPYDGTDDGNVNGLVAGELIVLDPTGTAEVVEIISIDESTGAATNTVTLTIDSDLTAGDQATGTANGFAVALIIGERRTATVTITNNTVTTGNTSGTHVVTTTFTSQTDGGVTVDGSAVTVTVTKVQLNVTKYVRNVTTAANNPVAADITIPIGTVNTDFYASNVSAEPGSADGATPGDTLEYLIVVSNPVGFAQADNIIVSDPVPAFTTFVTGSIRLDPIAADSFVNPSEGGADGDAAETNSGSVYVYAGSGGADDTVPGAGDTTGPDGDGRGGSLTGGQTSYVLFRVTLD